MDEDKKDIIEIEKVEEPKNEPVTEQHTEEKKTEEPKVEVIKEEPAKDKKDLV